jgi:hypothetical protein
MKPDKTGGEATGKSTHEQTPISVIKAISGWLTIQPDYSPPAPSPRAILDAYPKLVEWGVERVITAMSEPAI